MIHLEDNLVEYKCNININHALYSPVSFFKREKKGWICLTKKSSSATKCDVFVKLKCIGNMKKGAVKFQQYLSFYYLTTVNM